MNDHELNGHAAALATPKPQPSTRNHLENIPAELKALPQWVLWRPVEIEGGKWTKIPHQARPPFAKALSSDPKTWTTFDVAADAHRQRRKRFGLGFVFAADDPYVGVDIDHCRDPETGELTKRAQTILRRFATYAEVSPSGTGVKLVCRGALERAATGGGVEMYTHGRYFVITGDMLPGHEEIADAQAAIDWLVGKLRCNRRAEQRPAPVRNGHVPQASDVETARAALARLAPARADNYAKWLQVGQALHATSPDLLPDWSAWSQRSAKYRQGECESKWAGFNGEGGISLGSLIHWANADDPPVDRKALRLTKKLIDINNEIQGKPCDAKPAKKSVATQLVELCEGLPLFHTPGADGETYAVLPIDGREATTKLKSRAFSLWLRRRYYEAEESAPNGQAMADAIGVLQGKAIYDGEQREVHLRLAEHEGRIYLDLGDPSWRAVVIDAKGWRITDAPPVRFRRARAMLPLPEPEPGGTVNELQRFLNVEDTQWPLIVTWLAAALRPTGPYPLVCLHGEQGSAKSTTARVLRELVDPNAAPLRAEPREVRDLAIAGANGWCVCLDNLSHLTPWLSDALCRLATGGGFSTRTLYTDEDEQIFDATRPAILTGIGEVATRADLLDRALLVTLPTIPEERRRPEKKFWRAFNRARPRILGALLNAVAAGLANLPHTRLERLPRMADFALWATACEPALGLEPGEFMQAYDANRAAANETALDCSTVAKYVRALVEDGEKWSGTFAGLLTVLERKATEQELRSKYWPANPRALSVQVRRLAPNLRAAGIEVEFAGVGGHTHIELRPTANN